LIHLITALTKNGRISRTFGYYATEAEALEAVKENRGGMDECLYEYAVIEAVPPGIFASAEATHWFQWANQAWTPCECPFPHVTNFGIG